MARLRGTCQGSGRLRSINAGWRRGRPTRELLRSEDVLSPPRRGSTTRSAGYCGGNEAKAQRSTNSADAIHGRNAGSAVLRSPSAMRVGRRELRTNQSSIVSVLCMTATRRRSSVRSRPSNRLRRARRQPSRGDSLLQPRGRHRRLASRSEIRWRPAPGMQALRGSDEVRVVLRVRPRPLRHLDRVAEVLSASVVRPARPRSRRVVEQGGVLGMSLTRARPRSAAAAYSPCS